MISYNINTSYVKSSPITFNAVSFHTLSRLYNTCWWYLGETNGIVRGHSFSRGVRNRCESVRGCCGDTRRSARLTQPAQGTPMFCLSNQRDRAYNDKGKGEEEVIEFFVIFFYVVICVRCLCVNSIYAVTYRLPVMGINLQIALHPTPQPIEIFRSCLKTQVCSLAFNSA